MEFRQIQLYFDFFMECRQIILLFYGMSSDYIVCLMECRQIILFVFMECRQIISFALKTRPG